ncbi:hypothetical protein Tco_0248459 [Tanacetum coccineum]
MHIVQDDSILGSLKFVSKTKEYQVYGALIPARMTKRKMQNSHAYKTYLAFTTGATTTKKARKFKKLASSSKKITLVAVEEPAKKPTKKPTVPDELKGKSIDTSEETGLKPRVPDVSKADSSEIEYESWGDSDDNNDDNDQQSEDEQSISDNPRTNDEEYDRINKEMYDDVNVELKDVEPADEGKSDEEMTDNEKVNDKHEEVNQEAVGDQVKDDAQAIVTAASATQKTEVIPESSTAPTTIIPPPILPFILLPQLSILIPTPTTIKATISTTFAPDSTTHTAIHQRLSDLENEVKILRNVDHSLAIRTTIKFEVPTVVKEYLGTSQDDTLHKVIQRHIAELIKEHSVQADHKALYHALMESILKDEDAMDKGVADKSKKRKPDDVDRDEGPPA